MAWARKINLLAERQTALSNASLGIPDETPEVKKRYLRSYTRNNYRVTRCVLPRLSRSRYAEVLEPPALRWYPSKYTSFWIGVDTESAFLVKWLPKQFNASVWLAKNEALVLRVPKDRGEEARQVLRQRGLYFNTKTYRWMHRRRKKRRTMQFSFQKRGTLMAPTSQYFRGKGEQVLSSMEKEYGAKKGKQVFYATAAKRDLTAKKSKAKKKS